MIHLLAVAAALAQFAAGVVELDLVLLQRLSGFVLPLVVGLVTKKVSSSGLKATLLFCLAIVSAVVTTLIDAGGRMPVAELINAFFNIFITAAGSYYVLLKPTGISDMVVEKTRNFGIGSPPSPTFETADKGAEAEGEAIAETLAEPARGPDGKFIAKG